MTAPQSTTKAAPSPGRSIRKAARHNLSKRWALLAFAGLAGGIGLYFGGWAWLVAVGAAQIILSTLPCLVMCGFGFCMMCRSGEKKSDLPRDAANAATSISQPGSPSWVPAAGVGAGCCYARGGEMQSPQLESVESLAEKRDPHA